MQTEVFTCETPQARKRSLKAAARILKAGGIVAFPTETVYGLGVVAGKPEAEKKLREVRGRGENKPFSVAIADRLTVPKFASSPPLLSRRLMNRCWPGPLTIVLENPDGSTVGLRYPANETAQLLIRQAGGALLAPSANLPGEKEARTTGEVLATFDGKIEAVVDDGAAQIGKPSTVIRMCGKTYEILREGALSISRIRRAANMVILFVCSGNSCRSPMAEAICRRLIAEMHTVNPDTLEEHGYTVMSAGTSCRFAASATDLAIKVMREMGLDISNHLSQNMTSEMVEHADLVFAMTSDQMNQVRQLSKGSSGSIMLLDPKGRPIDDPVGGDEEAYRRCAYVIREAMTKRLEEL